MLKDKMKSPPHLGRTKQKGGLGGQNSKKEDVFHRGGHLCTMILTKYNII